MADIKNTSALALIQYNKKKEDYTSLSERDEAALFAQCVELQVLKAPATAKFPDLDEMIVNGSNGRYSVSGYVDSANSYGAMIRNNYSYNVEKDEMGNWKCTDTFVDTGTAINASLTANTILWWVLGIIGTLITFGLTFLEMEYFF